MQLQTESNSFSKPPLPAGLGKRIATASSLGGESWWRDSLSPRRLARHLREAVRCAASDLRLGGIIGNVFLVGVNLLLERCDKMPVLLRNRIGGDTLRKLVVSADARKLEGRTLHLDGLWLGAVYLYGYSVEMRVKTSYFVASGFGRNQQIARRDRQDAGRDYQQFGLPGGLGPHDIFGWAQLLVAKRVNVGQPYHASFARELLMHAQRVHERWTEVLRYRPNRPYGHEVMTVAQGAAWFEQNFETLRG